MGFGGWLEGVGKMFGGLKVYYMLLIYNLNPTYFLILFSISYLIYYQFTSLVSLYLLLYQSINSFQFLNEFSVKIYCL